MSSSAGPRARHGETGGKDGPSSCPQEALVLVGPVGEGIDGKQQINKILCVLKLTKQLREEGARAGGGGYLLEEGGQRGPHCDLKLELACKYRVWGQGAEGPVRANVEEEPDPRGLECWVQSELLLR